MKLPPVITRNKPLIKFLLLLGFLGAYFLYLSMEYGAGTGGVVAALSWSFFVLCTPIADGGFLLDFPIRLLLGLPMMISEIVVWTIAISLNGWALHYSPGDYDTTSLTRLFHTILTQPYPYWGIIFLSGLGTFLSLRFPGLKMSVVQADGQNVEPVTIDEFRFAPAETYDVIVTPKEDKAYTIAAEPMDRTGFALGSLATAEGMKGEIPAQRPRALLSMADMDMEQMMKDDPDMEMTPADMISGWAKTGTPEGQKALSYADLRYAGVQKDQREPQRTIDVRLGGNMERYIWTINGKKFSEAEPIRLKYGERVRLKFTNESMMAHPMHLHGMFVQLENGQPAAKLPNKHTVIVPPGQSYSVLLTADEVGEWAFHCHLLYHMASGMMRQVVVAKLDAADMPATETTTQGGHHAH